MKKAFISSILVSMFASMAFAGTAIECRSSSLLVSISDNGQEATLERLIPQYLPANQRMTPLKIINLVCAGPQQVPTSASPLIVECKEPNLKYGSFVIEVFKGIKSLNHSPTLRLSELRADGTNLYPYPIDYLGCRVL